MSLRCHDVWRVEWAKEWKMRQRKKSLSQKSMATACNGATNAFCQCFVYCSDSRANRHSSLIFSSVSFISHWFWRSCVSVSGVFNALTALVSVCCTNSLRFRRSFRPLAFSLHFCFALRKAEIIAADRTKTQIDAFFPITFPAKMIETNCNICLKLKSNRSLAASIWLLCLVCEYYMNEHNTLIIIM